VRALSLLLSLALGLAFVTACNAPSGDGLPTAATTLSIPRAQFASAGLDELEVGVIREDTGHLVTKMLVDLAALGEDQVAVTMRVPAGVPLRFRANAALNSPLLQCEWDEFKSYICPYTGATRALLRAGESSTVDLTLDFYDPYASLYLLLPGAYRGGDAVFVFGYARGLFAPSLESLRITIVEIISPSQAGLGAQVVTIEEPVGGLSASTSGWGGHADFPGEFGWVGVFPRQDCPAMSACTVYFDGGVRDDLGWFQDICYLDSYPCTDGWQIGAADQATWYAMSVGRVADQLEVTLAPRTGTYNTDFYVDSAIVTYRGERGQVIDGLTETTYTGREAFSAQAFDEGTGNFTFSMPYRGAGTVEAFIIVTADTSDIWVGQHLEAAVP
jgi:hypothetical protein